MPALANLRRERFAKNVVKGMSQTEAYIKAGYRTKTPQSAWSNASILIRIPKVASRIRELLKKAETDVIISVESMTNVYVDLLEGAQQVGNFNAAKGAADSLSKLHGLIVDRKETGAPGDFSRMNDDQLREYVASAITEAGAGNTGQADLGSESGDEGC